MTATQERTTDRLFGSHRVRVYELLFVVMASLAVNILTTDLKDGTRPLELMADLCALASGFAIFAIYARMASLWEESLLARDGDAIGKYNRNLDDRLRRRLFWYLVLAVGLAVASGVSMYFAGVTLPNTPPVKGP